MSTLSEQTPVVILAGGKGTRLKPYTTALPKPLVPVGDYPILDILLQQLGTQGFRRITLAVGHLAGLIQAYFKEGEDWGIDLEYAYETAPLGTAGPIARLPREERALLVLNGDLLTTLDFAQLVRLSLRKSCNGNDRDKTKTADCGIRSDRNGYKRPDQAVQGEAESGLSRQHGYLCVLSARP
jgi:choline kinase